MHNYPINGIQNYMKYVTVVSSEVFIESNLKKGYPIKLNTRVCKCLYASHSL